METSPFTIACTSLVKGASFRHAPGLLHAGEIKLVPTDSEDIDQTTRRTNRAAEAVLQRARSAHRHAMEMGAGLGNEGLRFTDKVRLAYWNAFQHDCLNTAKATAYSAIFAIFPMIAVLAAMIALVPYTGPLRSQIEVFAVRVLPESVWPLFSGFFNTTHSKPQSTTVLLAAIFVSVGGAAGVLATLMEGFRRAYGLTENCWGSGWRGLLRRQLQSYLMVPIAALPMAVASLLVIFGHYGLLGLMRYSPTGWDSGLYWTANVVRWVASLSATAAVLAVIYRFGIPVRPGWREVMPGAAFATATWFVSTLAFGFYVTRYTHYSKVYGSLGTGVVLLVWLFLTSLTVLCGAELNAELARDAGPTVFDI
ncbi:YihY/virulence factor BrkB family protein [Terriglobus sp. TAA 43]|uniref:YihY/virulence factor BrkB family protein n=1 Tax=Terriglobus sp. TAA 43 TaxID=278961 RepID=UPI001E3E7E09|nr:YihY/virulence factor BrkB family protein [Terriglobus sp. TAA 43]